MAVKMVQGNGVQLWTESFGMPTDPLVLLIMGANASAMYWPDEFVALLVEGGRRVIRYDHRDTGKSTHTDFREHPYSISDLARDAVTVLDGYSIDCAHIVGLSMGGSIAQILAIDHRSRVKTLTVMLAAALDVDFIGNYARALRGEASPDGLPTPTPEIVQVLMRRSERGRNRDEELVSRINEWRALSGNQVTFEEREFLRYEERAMEHAETHEQPIAHAFAQPFPIERGGELRGVTAPTLVVQGALDPLNSPPHGRHIADLIPNARLVEIPVMGHALPRAVYHQVAELITAHTAPKP